MVRGEPAANIFGRPFRYAIGELSVLSVCLTCLSVTLMYCGQTVGWIKMKLGMEVGPVPAIVLDGDPAPLQKGHSHQFRPMSVVAKRLDGSGMPDGTEVGLGPGDIVLDGDPPCCSNNSFGDRCFAAAEPRLWNTLPVQLRHCDSLGQFKRLLKTYLFGGWDRSAL